jgi:hypothetical protein
MNKRTKELFNKALDQAVPETWTTLSYEQMTKLSDVFALLIVRECVEELRYTVLDTQELRRDKSTDYQVGWEDGMFDAEEMIKQHFRS